MCGIFGAIGPAPVEFKKRLFQQLALETRVRGTDATGLAYIGENGKIQVIKSPESAEKFLKKDEVQAVMENFPEIILGHNRKKTVGDPANNANNHPIFTKETGLVLIHNGGVSNHYKWRTVGDDGSNPFIYKKFDADVDSEAILRLIETFLYIPREADLSVDPYAVYKTPKEEWERGAVPVEFAIQDAVHNLAGGQACALLDEKDPNTIYLWVTSNPMWIYFIIDYNVIMFASADDIAEKALEDQEVEYEWFHEFFWREILHKDKTPEVISYKVPSDTLIKIEMVQGKKGTEYKIDKFELQPDKAVTKPFDFPEEAGEVPIIITEDDIITVEDN